MKRKYFLVVFEKSLFCLLIILLSSLLISGCSPSDLIFGPSGSIEVDTYPTGAKIFLNGNDTGHITPYTITNLVKGTYEIKLTLGNISYTKTVIVYSDNISTVYKDLLPRLDKIVVQPPSIDLKEGDFQTINSITAYYFDSSTTEIKLSACSYSSNSNHATVNSMGTITGVSEGSAIITVSYTEVEITKTDSININVTTIPPPTEEPVPEIGNITVSANPESNVPGGTSIISAIVINTDGDAVPNGTTVYFYSNSGELSADSSTTTNGIATVNLTLDDNMQAGETAKITAFIGAVSGYIEVKCIETIVTIYADDYLISEGGTSNITAVVTEKDGTPVDNGVIVIFFTDTGYFDASTSLTTVYKPTASGIATTTLTLDTDGDIATVNAKCGSRVSNKITIECK